MACRLMGIERQVAVARELAIIAGRQPDRSGSHHCSNVADPRECEDKLVETLLVYGRACYQLDPTDKLLQGHAEQERAAAAAKTWLLAQIAGEKTMKVLLTGGSGNLGQTLVP